MDKRWVYKKDTDQDTIVRLIEQLGVTKPIATILGQRGIQNFEAAKAFFRPDLDELHDPFEMLNMVLAVERISTAILNQENILIYGDYDVDGTTAVALMYEYLTREYELSLIHI